METRQQRASRLMEFVSYLKAEKARIDDELVIYQDALSKIRALEGPAMLPMSLVGEAKRKPRTGRRGPPRGPSARSAKTQRLLLQYLEDAGQPMSIAEATARAMERGDLASIQGKQGVRNIVASGVRRLKANGLISVDPVTHRFAKQGPPIATIHAAS